MIKIKTYEVKDEGFEREMGSVTFTVANINQAQHNIKNDINKIAKRWAAK